VAGGIISNLMYAVGFKIKSNPLNAADKKVGKLTKSVIGLGAAVATMAVGIGAAGLTAATKYEDAMKHIEGATGMAAQQMQETREIAKNLYSQNFGADWQDLGSAIANVQQVTKLAGDELEKTTKNALLLRDTFGFEINESVKATDTMMRQFGITSGQAMGLIAQGAQAGLDKSGELMDSANEYANQFKSLGFSASEMFDVFAAGSAEGVFQLDKVGDAVKEFNIRSKDGSKTSIEAFQMLGLNADKMMQTFAAGGPAAQQAFSDVVSMISDVADPVAKNMIGVALMGSQFEDLEANVISAMGSANKQFDMSKNTLGELQQVKMSKPMEAFRSFGRQIETGILIPIGQKLLPPLNRFGKWLTSHKPQIDAAGEAIGTTLGNAIERVGGFISDMMPYLKEFGGVLVEGFQLVAPVVEDIFTGLVNVVGTITQWEGFLPVVVGLTAALITYKGVVAGVALVTKLQALWTMRAAIATNIATIATKALSLAMTLNPIGLIVAAVIGLGVALVIAYKKSDKFRAIVDAVGRAIKVGFVATLNFFKVTVPRIFNSVLDWIKRWGPRIITVITGPIGWVVLAVIKNWDKIKTTTVNTFSAVRDWLAGVWNSITTKVRDVMGGIKTTISNAWDDVKTKVSGVADGIKGSLLGIWDDVKGGFIKGINWVIDKVNDLINRVNTSLTFDIPDFLGGGHFDLGIPTISPIPDGSHKNGLAKVPFDGYLARLHKDERVLTAEENKRYTPETAPARAAASSRHEIALKVDFSGSGGTKMDSKTEARLRQLMEETFASAMRRMGLEGA